MADHVNICPPRDFCSYSVVSDAEDAWAQLASLKVFRSASWTSALDCIDVVVGTDDRALTHKRTFHNAKDLEEYFEKAPPKARTRFM